MTRNVLRAKAFRTTAGVLAVSSMLLSSGCSAPLPNVSFYGDRATVAVPPSLWCAADASLSRVDCRVDRGDTDAPRLRLGTGMAVSLNVPARVSAAPWVVLFRYRDAAGATQQARGPLFAAGAAAHWILRTPSASDQLLRVEVQSGLTPVSTATGTGVDYAALHTWVVIIDPAP